MLDREALEAFVALLPRHADRPARVLDAGCGERHDAAYLYNAGLQIEGIDSCEERIREAKTRYRSGPDFRVADILFLSATTDAPLWDGVWVNRSLIQMGPAAVQRALAIFFRLMVPQGILYLAMDVVAESEMRDGNYLYPEAEISSLLRQNGFLSLVQGRKKNAYPNSAETVSWLCRRIGSPLSK